MDCLAIEQLRESQQREITPGCDWRPTVEEMLVQAKLPEIIGSRGNYPANIDRNGYLVHVTAPIEVQTEENDKPHTFNDFLTEVNKLIPSGWSIREFEDRNLMHPVIDGIVTSPRDTPLTRGAHLHGLADLLMEFPDPQMHLSFCSNILSVLHDEKADLLTRKYAAEFAFYICCPIAESYGLAELLAELQDAAFRTLDPENYKYALLSWQIAVGYRYTYFELNELARKVEEDLITLERNGQGRTDSIGMARLSPTESNWEVTIRQKSLYSYYVKTLELEKAQALAPQNFNDKACGRDGKLILVEDPIALTAVYKGDGEPKEMSLYFERLLQGLVTDYEVDSSTPGYRLVSGITNTFNNPREDDKGGHYKVVKAAMALNLGHLPMRSSVNSLYSYNQTILKVCLTTEKAHRVNQVMHPVYKLFYRTGIADAMHKGFSRRKAAPLMDYAQTLFRRKLKKQEGSYCLNSTKQIVENLKNGLKGNGSVLLFTRTGNTMIRVTTTVDLNNQLTKFADNIHRSFNNVQFFAVQRIDASGGAIYYVDIKEGTIVKQNAKGLREKIDPATFRLTNLDRIELLQSLKVKYVEGIPTDIQSTTVQTSGSVMEYLQRNTHDFPFPAEALAVATVIQKIQKAGPNINVEQLRESIELNLKLIHLIRQVNDVVISGRHDLLPQVEKTIKYIQQTVKDNMQLITLSHVAYGTLEP